MTFKEQHENYKRPEKISGIYKITNLINKKVYIGKSIDVFRRFIEHRNPNEWKRTPNKPLYLAFQKYDLKNFSFEILERCKKEELNSKEQYWIKSYNAINSTYGYNVTVGGDGYNPDENHPNHKLTVEDVINIRTRYNQRERRMEVEKDFVNKVGPSGFKKVWQGETWSDIMPEVYSQENKNYHRNNTGLSGSKNGRALLSECEVYDIRTRKLHGEHWEKVYDDYKSCGIKKSSFRRVWQGSNWKHVVVE